MTKHEHAEHSFTTAPESIGAARSFARETLETWHLSACTDDVQLCVSELASNAVTHGARGTVGHGEFQVRIDADEALIRVEVEDGDTLTRPRVRRAADGDTGGRGMAIVQSLSAAWGCDSQTPGGKTVWSEFRTAAA
ncbi:ATP-binding protein [Streptomyces wuyuanensis]|uniref:ATP-binding protein n=1 Tax=Streptomyces wuyuanensis TaxID=1196353 RepID=UPI00341BF1B7